MRELMTNQTFSFYLYIAGVSLAVAIIIGSLFAIKNASNSVSTDEGTGCYVITADDGHRILAQEPPKYNVQTGALNFKLGYAEGFVFRPRQVEVNYRCEDVPTPSR